MSIKCTPLLRPLFALLAHPGIGGPHSPAREAELMASGAKRLLITGYPFSHQHKELEPLLEEGKIVLIGCSTDRAYASILCHPDVFNEASKVAEIFEKRESDIQLSNEDIQFRRTYEQSNTRLSFSPEDNQRYRKASSSPLSELELLRSGQVKSSVMLFFNANDKTSAPPEISEALENGEIKTATLSWPNPACVFAQADDIEDGRELFARYFVNDLGYPHYPDKKDAVKRVGELLGYTGNDTALFTGTKYRNPLIRRLLIATENFRREIRTELMLYDRQNKAPQVK